MTDDKHGPACPDCGGEMHEVTTGYGVVNTETGETIYFATIREAMVWTLAKEREEGLHDEAVETEKMIEQYDAQHRRAMN